MNSNIGRLTYVELRDVWKHEARDFTTWLQEHIDQLGDALDVTLQDASSEESVGDFNVDILAEDGEGRSFAIENQLESSDHRHLGQLVTYVSNLEADVAVWLVAEARPEHVQAVSWLNESSAAHWYLVQANAVRVDDSSPAFLPLVVVRPSEEAREVGKRKKQEQAKRDLRREFWRGLLSAAKEKSDLHAGSSPRPGPYVDAASEVPGLQYIYWINKNDGRVELWIDRGPDSTEENRAIFNFLLENRDEIEEVFGDSLEWDEKTGARSWSIRYRFDEAGYADKEAWPELQENMSDAMSRFEEALRPHLETLRRRMKQSRWPNLGD